MRTLPLLGALLFAQAALAAELVDAEVRKIDQAAGKITLRHGEIPNIEMPPMTMVFQVRDPNWLDRVKAGDEVKSAAEKSGPGDIVTELLPTP